MNRIMLRAAAVGTAMMLAAAGCKNDTPSDPEPKPVPVSAAIAALKTYLAGQLDGASPAEPVPLELSVALSAEDTVGLFAALDSVGKYFRLDLSGCTGLTEWGTYTDAGKVVSLVLPDSVAEIAEGTYSAGTFASFTSLETLTANKAETVGNYAFYRCTSLASANLPSATAIGEGAFLNCAALTSVNLPSAATIKASAFNSCSALASVSLPAAAAIGNYAFSGTALVSANLYSAAAIGIGAFAGCAGLTDIRVSSDNPNYTVKDGMLLNKAETTLFAYPSANGDIVLPESIITIGDDTFRGCPALKTVSLPAATAIGAGAFQTCAVLETANLPAAATIGANAFQGCPALKTVNLPAATDIGDRAFQTCAALASASLPAAGTIGNYAFSSCTALVSVNIPAAAAIGNYAFSSCTALASLTLGTTLPTLGNMSVFSNAGKDTEGFTVYVPTAQMKTAIDTIGSDWYTAHNKGNFSGVAVAQ